MTTLPDSLPVAGRHGHVAALTAAASAAARCCRRCPRSRPAPRSPATSAPPPGSPAPRSRASRDRPGAVAVLVGADLVQALRVSPLGSLDLAAAAQPALDAAAAALGAKVAAARTVPIELAINDLGYPFTLVPLLGDGGSAALLVNDAASPLGASARAPSSRRGPRPRPPRPSRASAGCASAVPPPASGRARPPAAWRCCTASIMDVTVELGRARMSVRELLALSPGTVLELDRAAGSPADLLVNGRLIARGEVVVVDEDFGLRVTEIVDDAALRADHGRARRPARLLPGRHHRHAAAARPGQRQAVPGRRDALVRVVHRQPLSRTSAVAVVTVGSRVLVLGTTEHQVQLLTELDAEELEASPRREDDSSSPRSATRPPPSWCAASPEPAVVPGA